MSSSSAKVTCRCDDNPCRCDFVYNWVNDHLYDFSRITTKSLSQTGQVARIMRTHRFPVVVKRLEPKRPVDKLTRRQQRRTRSPSVVSCSEDQSYPSLNEGEANNATSSETDTTSLSYNFLSSYNEVEKNEASSESDPSNYEENKSDKTSTTVSNATITQDEDLNDCTSNESATKMSKKSCDEESESCITCVKAEGDDNNNSSCDTTETMDLLTEDSFSEEPPPRITYVWLNNQQLCYEVPTAEMPAIVRLMDYAVECTTSCE